MSRRNRNKRHDRQPSQRSGNGQGQGQERTYRYTEPPPPPVLTDFSQMRISDFLEAGPDSAPTPEADGANAGEDENGSRFNALRAALRSKILFPATTLRSINEAARGFALRLHPSGPLEDYLVWEMARGSVQSKLCSEQLVVNVTLAARRAASGRWADDRREDADKLGARLSGSPDRVKGALERTKYGTLFLIEKLTDLGDVVSTHGCLSGEQRERLGDLLGVDPLVRDGSRRLPPAGDGAALSAVIASEVARHQEKLEQDLNERDREEASAAAELGIVRQYDQETRRLHSDRGRADRRFNWAWDALRLVQSGVDPATIIDPETRKPVAVGPKPASRPDPAPPADPPPPPPPPPSPSPAAAAAADDTSSPPQPPSQPAPNLPPFPEGYSEQSCESLMIFAEAYHQARAAARAATFAGGSPPGDGDGDGDGPRQSSRSA